MGILAPALIFVLLLRVVPSFASEPSLDEAQQVLSLKMDTSSAVHTGAEGDGVPLKMGIEEGQEVAQEVDSSSSLDTSIEVVSPSEMGIQDGVYVNDFNATACAELHNQIVNIVVNAPHQPKNVLKKFFDAFEDEEQKMRERLSTPLIDFLSQIYVPVLSPEEKPWIWIDFTPLLTMPHPSILWSFEDWELGNEYVLLYADAGDESTGGIFFDMETNLISMVTLPDQFMEDCLWHYPEVALRRYLELFELGKFRLPTNETGVAASDALNLRFEPTQISIQLVDEFSVTAALDTYDALLEAIAQRIPGARIYNKPLVDKRTLIRWKITGLAFEFLSHARTPSFKYIAPGISVFNKDSFTAMMQLNNGSLQQWVVDRDIEEQAPMLLFPGDAPVRVEEEEQYLFNLMHPYLMNNQSGLYSVPGMDFGDTVELILPYSVGHPSARSHSRLFQHGPCPFFKGHNTRLFSLFSNWVRNVESGGFVVGANGVEGGMGAYMLADTEASRIRTDVGVCW
ncbi:hypothetical protein D9758_010537 [Tetrapyrgos nigripes]|uniref:Uncharacterized protein n=1 Tax=Tetrapyrgos nigripes TaxID=182062 RepID=A0A8H5FV44_9AGAR|nr:hypothetical protein D9758_010537 [Tetrapyrgos nigripes]